MLEENTKLENGKTTTVCTVKGCIFMGSQLSLLIIAVIKMICIVRKFSKELVLLSFLNLFCDMFVDLF